MRRLIAITIGFSLLFNALVWSSHLYGVAGEHGEPSQTLVTASEHAKASQSHTHEPGAGEHHCCHAFAHLAGLSPHSALALPLVIEAFDKDSPHARPIDRKQPLSRPPAA